MAEYIERDDALLALSYYHIGKPEPADIIPAVLETARKSVAKINAADVAPVRHRKWLEWFPGDCALIMTGEEMLYRCSSCDAKYSGVEGYKYCPNCGAKMDEEVSDGKQN